MRNYRLLGFDLKCSLTLVHDLICGFCSSDQRFARRLVCSPHPASFRFHLTMNTLAFGYILPTTGRIRDFHSLETCAARRTFQMPLHGYPKATAFPYPRFILLNGESLYAGDFFMIFFKAVRSCSVSFSYRICNCIHIRAANTSR